MAVDFILLFRVRKISKIAARDLVLAGAGLEASAEGHRAGLTLLIQSCRAEMIVIQRRVGREVSCNSVVSPCGEYIDTHSSSSYRIQKIRK